MDDLHLVVHLSADQRAVRLDRSGDDLLDAAGQPYGISTSATWTSATANRSTNMASLPPGCS
ncbi:hypothetical protein [Actinomadura nitritigenes]|uniref:hypothetical protein n=1 Tax=Actinomadura nitritigenes TaxID=134602 RepID=UPI003D8C0E9C